MEENCSVLLPHPVLIDWDFVVEREPHSLPGLEGFNLSKWRKNKTLAEAWTAVDLERDSRGWHRCNPGGGRLCFHHTVSVFWYKNKTRIWISLGLLNAVVVPKSSQKSRGREIWGINRHLFVKEVLYTHTSWLPMFWTLAAKLSYNNFCLMH